jgi:predicted aconitase
MPTVRSLTVSLVPASLRLSEEEQGLLAGVDGEGVARAMRLLCEYANVVGARELIPIASAHIDSCLYHGRSSLDFVDLFSGGGTRVRVPTTLNVAALDMRHCDGHQADTGLAGEQRKLTNAYVALGCLPTLTCAPYQRANRPKLGQQIAWAESNAIVFANSVLGARTERYGDFIDLCAALTGRVAAVGLHLDEGRLASMVVEVAPWAESDLERDLYFAAVGYRLGELAGSRVAALTGLPAETSEDDLKALGAASASSGAVAMFHAVGITPEATDLAQATGGKGGLEECRLDGRSLRHAVSKLCPVEPGEPIAAVCLGTPHFSVTEFRRLANLVSGRRAETPFRVSTSREIADTLANEDCFDALDAFGMQLVVDTCTYLAPMKGVGDGVILTNSAKWAHYGPGNLARRAGLMDMARCVRCAEAGRVVD